MDTYHPNPPTGCGSCTMVVHPTDGFFGGLHKKPKLDTPDSEVKPKCLRDLLPAPYSPSRDANRKIDALHKQQSFHWSPPTSPTLSPSREENRVEIPDIPKSECVRRAKLALECYNEENNKDYEVVEALGDECTIHGGIWYHCNFTAKLPNSDTAPMFFAEMEIRGYKLGNVNCEVTAVHKLEAGETDVGCLGCTEVIHPRHGFVEAFGYQY